MVGDLVCGIGVGGVVVWWVVFEVVVLWWVV